MRPERWQQIERLFAEAADCPLAERASLLDRLCAGDAELRREVESLLACDDPDRPLLDAAPESPDMTGRRIGAYQLTGLIGQGGMGAVYRGVRVDDQYHKQVAIKLLKRGMDTDFMLSRFRQERQILANLEHPFIARLLDGGATEDGLPYFVMEYVDGVPITDYCEQKHLTIRERLRLFRLVCEAVQHAHQHLVIHRDLKPGNILTSKEGVPKLLDFGIAKVINPERPAGATLTRGEFRMLTPDYASPEQVKALPISTASDVYSLGAVLYQLLAGQRPHRITTSSPAELERIICEVEPEKPSIVAERLAQVPQAGKVARRQIEGDLDNIVAMAMRKEPERRYASVAALSEDLLRHLDGLPIQAQSDRWGYRAGKFVRRNRLAVSAAVIVAVSLIGGIVATTIQAQRAERRFAIARQLAQSVMREVSGTLAAVPGSTAARASMVETVASYLDRLSQEPGRAPEFDLEMADAYREVGSIEAHPTRQNLGRSAEALAHYASALSLYQGVYDRPSITREARIHALSGIIGTNIEAGDVEARMGNWQPALERLQKADKLAKEATVRDATLLSPGTAVYLYSRFGTLEQRGGNPQGALEQFRKALSISQAWDAEVHSVNSRSTTRGLFSNVAGALLNAGDLEGALENYNLAKAQTEKNLKQPDATVYERSTLASAHTNIGDVLGHPDDLNYGDRAAALEHYDAAVEILEDIANADPQDVRAQDDLSGAYRSKAGILLDVRPAEALKTYERALAILSRPGGQDPRTRGSIGWTKVGMGRALILLGRPREAVPLIEEGLPGLEAAAEADPTQLSAIASLGRAHRHLGDALLAAGDRQRALDHYKLALGFTEDVARRGPGNLYLQRFYADSLEALGRYHGRSAEARVWLEKSLAIWREWKLRKLALPYASQRERQVSAWISAIDE